MFKFWYKEFPQYPSDHPDYWRVRLIIHALLIVSCYFCILTMTNLVAFSNYTFALLDGTGLLISLGIYVYFRKTEKVDWAAWAVTILITSIVLLFVMSAGGYRHSLFWATIIPPVAFFLLGKKWGSWVSFFAFSVCIFLGYRQYLSPQTGSYGFAALLNVIEVSAAHILLFRFYEHTRSSAYRQLAIRNTDILRMAETDKLTGLYNREKLDYVLAQLIQVKSDKNGLSVMILDIDHFKSINDQYGHLEGDRVLTSLAIELQQSMRNEDIVARWGGEEFVVVCVNASLTTAMALAQRLRANIANMTISGKHLTISVGVAQRQLDDNAESLLDRADTALYKAKRDGRNRVLAAL
tara:strand:- start:1748 stop:2803 length:1056 start_codon:yes stop_codon:yes gene_type:complete